MGGCTSAPKGPSPDELARLEAEVGPCGHFARLRRGWSYRLASLMPGFSPPR